MTGTSANTSWANGTMTLGYATTGSPAFVAGDAIVIAGYTANNSFNGTQTVTACSNTTVSFAWAPSTSVTGYGNVSGTPIPNLNVAGKAPTISGPKNTNGVTATQGLAIGEFIVYTVALSDADRTKSEKYLKNKWLGTN